MFVQIRDGIKPDRWYKPGEVYEVQPGFVGYRVLDNHRYWEVIHRLDCDIIYVAKYTKSEGE